MPKSVRRGYNIKDNSQFGSKNLMILKKAFEDLAFLCDRGYSIKKTIGFISNHYNLSERQSCALKRIVSSKNDIKIRKNKEILHYKDIVPEKVYVDGFNYIITLEVALSGSPVFKCMDGTYRDIAGIRGTYSIIDKTRIAIKVLKDVLIDLKIKSVVFLLDQPVSNTGRLKELIIDIFSDDIINVEVEIINGVDNVLSEKESVITSDAIILNKCISWMNIMPLCLDKLQNKWLIDVEKATIQ